MDGGFVPQRSLSVLVAEDNRTNSMIFHAFLERMGHSAVVVENGGDAVQAWRSGGFDLVLMDLRMPGMSGVEATREIREAEEACQRPRTPILALSADDDCLMMQSCLAQGMDGYVLKPCSLSALAAAIGEHVG